MSNRRTALEYTQRWQARHHLSATGAKKFSRMVPPIFGSAERTRVLIALCVNGPGTGSDLFKTVAQNTFINLLNQTLALLLKSGIVARRPYGTRPIYYINDGHPAFRELHRFCKSLALRWPPPKWPARKALKVAPSLPDPVTCNLFGFEATTRFFLLLSATGGVALGAGARALGLTGATYLRTTLERFVRIGMVIKWKGTWLDALGRNRPATLYALDDQFFAYKSLRAFVGKLIRRLHPDTMGYAQVLGKRGMRMLPEQSRAILELSPQRSQEDL